MAKKKPIYKFAKHEGGTFHFPRRVMNSDEFHALSPGARSLLFEFQAIFHPSINGRLNLSHAKAAQKLNVTEKTVSGYYIELMQAHFIEQSHDYCYTQGKSRLYRLTYEPCRGREPTDEWKASIAPIPDSHKPAD
jgi:hypothetical protein